MTSPEAKQWRQPALLAPLPIKENAALGLHTLTHSTFLSSGKTGAYHSEF